MSWLRIDDGFLENEKIAGLTDRAFRLHMAALCYSARNLTDGRLNRAAVRVISALVCGRKRHINELVFCRLWAATEDGYALNDYLEYNPDAASVKALREARKQAGQRGGEKSGRSRGQASAEASAEANAQASADPSASSNGLSKSLNPVPSPTPLKASNPVTATEDDAREPDPGHGPGDSELEEINRLLAQAAAQDMPE
jgi:hypothetical protein